jgi:hypothetical protein
MNGGTRRSEKCPVTSATAIATPKTRSGGAGSVNATPKSRKPSATTASKRTSASPRSAISAMPAASVRPSGGGLAASPTASTSPSNAATPVQIAVRATSTSGKRRTRGCATLIVASG